MKTEVLELPAVRVRVADYVALAKPRLNFLVVLSAMVAYYLGSGGQFDLLVFVNTLFGTALVAAGASALNQLYERDLDALMRRTFGRPIPDGRVQPAEASRFGTVLAGLGLVQLALGAGLLPAGVALLTLVTYLWIYTPLKRRTWLSTMIGAVPGALPPLIGWTAARGVVELPALILFAIIFFWQVPHFLAIAWIYREDYGRAGIPLLPVIEPGGQSTARQVIIYAVVLLPVSLAPAFVGLTGTLYLGTAVAIGIVFLGLTLRFARRRTLSNARGLFMGSIAYLPLLWGVMIIDRSPGLLG